MSESEKQVSELQSELALQKTELIVLRNELESWQRHSEELERRAAGLLN